jgi:general secretion pathway protein C
VLILANARNQDRFILARKAGLLLGRAMRSILPIPGARKLLICLYLGLSTFIAAHIVNAFIAQSLLVPETVPPPLPSQGDALRDSVSPQQLAQDLMSRGLFALPAESSQNAGSSTGAGLGPPLDVAKKLVLHGTALGIDDRPMAIVQDRLIQQQKLLHLHDHVPNVGQLVSIEKTRVLFQDRGQEEWLELAMLTDLEQARRMQPFPESSQGRPLAISQPAPFTHPAGLTPVVSLAAGISSAASSQPIQIIDRRELTKILSDIPVLLLQAQPVVSMIDGRFNGILLEAVRADGLYATMGLQTNDVLKRMNGLELREPSMVITALERMKDEHRVKVDLVRNKTPRTLTYEIR